MWLQLFHVITKRHFFLQIYRHSAAFLNRHVVAFFERSFLRDLNLRRSSPL